MFESSSTLFERHSVIRIQCEVWRYSSRTLTSVNAENINHVDDANNKKFFQTLIRIIRVRITLLHTFSQYNFQVIEHQLANNRLDLWLSLKNVSFFFFYLKSEHISVWKYLKKKPICDKYDEHIIRTLSHVHIFRFLLFCYQ